MMRQFTDSPFAGKVSQAGQSVSAVLLRVPVSVWRSVLLFLLLLWMCHSAASLFWRIMPSPELRQPKVLAVPIVTSVDASANLASIDVDAILTQKLFGDVVSVIEPDANQVVDVNEDELQETRLNLTLHAVMGSSDQNAARAIISGGGAQELYSVNDDIQSGVSLAKVLEKRIVLDNRGNLETLWLYSEGETSAAESRRVESNNYSAQNASGSRSTGSSADARRVESTGRQSRPVAQSRPQVSRAKSQPRAKPKSTSGSPAQEKRFVLPRSQLNSTKSIADSLRFSMHRGDSGDIVGVKVRPGRDRSLFDQSGLKTNDVVTSVNGILLNDMSKMRGVLQELQTATVADLEVLRGDQLLNISVSVN